MLKAQLHQARLKTLSSTKVLLKLRCIHAYYTDTSHIYVTARIIPKIGIHR